MGLSPLTNLVVSGNRVPEAATGTRLSTFTAPDADPGDSLSPVLSPLADGSVAVMFEPSFTGGTAPGTISIPAMVLGPDGSVLKDVTTSTARPDFVHRADGGKAVEVASAPAGKRRLPEAWSQDLGEAPVDDDSTGSADRSAPTGTVVVSPAEGLSSLLSKNHLTTVTYSEDSMTLTLL